ncbi:MAG: hypothetical protein R2820_09820 [Cyclobacteriaceae bacterium]|jgi:hypothetical protein|nr:hypothetical protein [Cyclobacteriaceae bacterium]MCB0487123.1 hypothetical protein [Cyclobacteriaceae bacterium]
MKWIHNVRNKSVASAALLSLCLLVLFSNHIDRDHTNNVKNSITTLYEDRLVAETYILTMTSDIYKIKEVLNAVGPNFDHGDNKIGSLISEIREVSNAYLKTTLTANEELKFVELMKIVNEFETSQLKNIELKSENADKALALLSELSAIQLEESKVIMNQAQTLYSSGEISTQFAFAVMIIILLVLQALVFTSKSSTTEYSAT